MQPTISNNEGSTFQEAVLEASRRLQAQLEELRFPCFLCQQAEAIGWVVLAPALTIAPDLPCLMATSLCELCFLIPGRDLLIWRRIAPNGLASTPGVLFTAVDFKGGA